MNRPTHSYMELRIDKDGEDPLFLRVPIFWDAIQQQWIGAIRSPKSKKLIIGTGKDSFELQNSFNVEMSKAFHFDEEIAEELLSMFKPLCYWKEIEDLGITL
jgi:hypothetical protein